MSQNANSPRPFYGRPDGLLHNSQDPYYQAVENEQDLKLQTL